jgi:hypothetical protein
MPDDRPKRPASSSSQGSISDFPTDPTDRDEHPPEKYRRKTVYVRAYLGIQRHQLRFLNANNVNLSLSFQQAVTELFF